MSTVPLRSFLLASKIISLNSSSVIFSPSMLATIRRSSSVMWIFFICFQSSYLNSSIVRVLAFSSCENKMKAFLSSFSAAGSDIFMAMISEKSLKSRLIVPYFSLSWLSFATIGLFRFFTSLFISFFPGSKPKARSPTLRSCTVMMPVLLVSNKSKASLISLFYSSVNS